MCLRVFAPYVPWQLVTLRAVHALRALRALHALLMCLTYAPTVPYLRNSLILLAHLTGAP